MCVLNGFGFKTDPKLSQRHFSEGILELNS